MRITALVISVAAAFASMPATAQIAATDPVVIGSPASESRCSEARQLLRETEAAYAEESRAFDEHLRRIRARFRYEAMRSALAFLDPRYVEPSETVQARRVNNLQAQVADLNRSLRAMHALLSVRMLVDEACSAAPR